MNAEQAAEAVFDRFVRIIVTELQLLELAALPMEGESTE